MRRSSIASGASNASGTRVRECGGTALKKLSVALAIVSVVAVVLAAVRAIKDVQAASRSAMSYRCRLYADSQLMLAGLSPTAATTSTMQKCWQPTPSRDEASQRL